ncbi:hypothetical protein BDV33DRAFT_186368 [Aspergillus novoparasiticus]|uniref:Uncharacterized protein n=1 Tax=Aspergillus novoparasiticus TaxID=986946 RepID=A0A5N6E518_9EURO|nr:hypothetical protein BDV33DRAFT_186368 [Aspergillus novoparasiticus]
MYFIFPPWLSSLSQAIAWRRGFHTTGALFILITANRPSVFLRGRPAIPRYEQRINSLCAQDRTYKNSTLLAVVEDVVTRQHSDMFSRQVVEFVSVAHRARIPH